MTRRSYVVEMTSNKLLFSCRGCHQMNCFLVEGVFHIYGVSDGQVTH